MKCDERPEHVKIEKYYDDPMDKNNITLKSSDPDFEFSDDYLLHFGIMRNVELYTKLWCELKGLLAFFSFTTRILTFSFTL